VSTRRPRVRGWRALVALYVAAVVLTLIAVVQAFVDERPNRAYASLGLLMLWAWLGSRAWKGRGAEPS
jgi:hypothetical protein